MADVTGCGWRCEWSELRNRVLTVDLGLKVMVGVAAAIEGNRTSMAPETLGRCVGDKTTSCCLDLGRFPLNECAVVKSDCLVRLDGIGEAFKIAETVEGIDSMCGTLERASERHVLMHRCVKFEVLSIQIDAQLGPQIRLKKVDDEGGK